MVVGVKRSVGLTVRGTAASFEMGACRKNEDLR